MRNKSVVIFSTKIVKVLVFISILLCGLATRVNASKINLVKDGKSDYVIVRPGNSSPSQIYSAEELQKYIEQMTGVKLTIQADSQALPAKAILLGNTRYTAKLLGSKPRMEKLGTEGFRIYTKAPYILLIGSKKRSTLYAVYELLEKYAGCRWYSSKFSVIPKKSTWTIPAIDDTQIPAITSRDLYYYEPMHDKDFSVRIRNNGHGSRLDEKHGGDFHYAKRLMTHTFYILMPPKEFYGKHPEYYSEWHGKRRTAYGSLCLSNTDVVKIITKRVAKLLREDPAALFIDLSATDGGTPCTCPECKAFTKREGSYSGNMIDFCNKISANLKKEFPNVYIETLAYVPASTQAPPKNIKPLNNTVPRLCSSKCDFSKPLNQSTYKKNVEYIRYIKGWSKISPKLLIWDYVTNFFNYIGPHPNFNALQGNIKFFRDNKVYGVLEQGNYNSPHGEFAELRTWILAKLLWNPDLDINKLYDDFFQGYYGAAAPMVRKYFDELQKLSLPDKHIVTIRTKMTNPMFPKGFFRNAKKLFDKAEAAVANDPQRLYNVRMSSIPVYFAILKRWPKLKTKQVWKNGGVKTLGVPAEYISLAKKIIKRLKEGKITHIAEGKTASRYISKLNNIISGQKPLTIKSGNLTAGSILSMGDMVSLLTIGDGHNYLNPALGGIEFDDKSRFVKKVKENMFFVKKMTPNSTLCHYLVRWYFDIARLLSVTAETLSVKTILTSNGPWEQTFAPNLKIALNIGNADTIFLRNGNSKWQSVGVPGNRLSSIISIAVDKLSSREISIASNASKRGIKIKLPELKTVNCLRINCSMKNNSVLIVVSIKPEILKVKSTNKPISFTLQLTPLKNIKALPETTIKEHSADIVELDYAMLPVHKVFGKAVVDQQAMGGHAIRLRPRPVWGLQWHIKPEMFTKGAKYKAKVHIKVEKSEFAGEAFNAGVWDYKHGGCKGKISIKTSQLKPGYHWYDIATFTPRLNQRIWVGSGKFNKKKGEKSAVKNVFIDKIKFIRVKAN